MREYNTSIERLTGTPQELVEKAGRVCYKSEDRIKDGSAEDFVKRMIKSGHHAMLEFFTKYYTIPRSIYWEDELRLDYWALDNGQVRITKDEFNIYLTTNLRRVIEMKDEQIKRILLNKDYQYRTEKHIDRIFYKVVTNLQVSPEVLRHRNFSFAQESTRLCNYSKGKFDKEIGILGCPDEKMYEFCKASQDLYMESLNTYKPEKASYILPRGLKTEMIIAGFPDVWDHFLKLRYEEKTGKVHPLMKELSTLIYEDLNEL